MKWFKRLSHGKSASPSSSTSATLKNRTSVCGVKSNVNNNNNCNINKRLNLNENNTKVTSDKKVSNPSKSSSSSSSLKSTALERYHQHNDNIENNQSITIGSTVGISSINSEIVLAAGHQPSPLPINQYYFDELDENIIGCCTMIDSCKPQPSSCSCCNTDDKINSLEHDEMCRNGDDHGDRVLTDFYDKNNLLGEQARRLEELIKLESLNDCGIFDRTIVDPDDFFEDPAEVIAFRDEVSLLSEWEIIDCVPRPPSSLSTQHGGLSSSTSMTSLDSMIDDDDAQYLTCQSPPSEPETPEASYYHTFEDEFQFKKLFFFSVFSRLKRQSQQQEEKVIENCDDDGDDHIENDDVMGVVTDDRDHDEIAQIKSENHRNYKMDRNYKSEEIFPTKGRSLIKTNSETDAIARSLMGPMLKDTPSTTNFCPLFNSSFDEKLRESENLKKSAKFSIQKYFGLNDRGDLIVQLDHIVEYSGFGYMAKKSMTSVSTGTEMTEKMRLDQKGLFTEMFKFLFDNDISFDDYGKLIK